MGYLDSFGLAHLWGKVKAALAAKQDKLVGTAGEVVGFDASGNAAALPGVTMEAVNSAIHAAIAGAIEETY